VEYISVELSRESREEMVLRLTPLGAR
jgi:hypothetical protein